MFRPGMVSFTCALSVTQIGCGQHDQDGTKSDSRQLATSRPNVLPTRNPKIPVEVSYPIIHEEEDYNAL